MIHDSAFYEIAGILILATLFGFVGQKLRQPLLIMFLAAGVVAGPAGLGIIGSYDQIELLAHMGIALLLFIVGLKLDLNLIRATGPVALATGMGQIVFTSVFGFLIALAMDIAFVHAAYIAVALTFSSTIIIVKLLSDKKEIDSLHGQIAVGFLIVQDIAAILALVALTTLGDAGAEYDSPYVASVIIAGKGLGFLGVIALLMKYVIPPLTRRLAHSVELLSIFAITWAVSLGAVSEMLGFSKEVGAFLAGVSLASTPYREAIGARLTSLRDFLLLFFFVDLGARLHWSSIAPQLGGAIIFSLFVLIGNPIIVLIIMGFMGYRRRTGFLAGLTVAQISEFSLILAALGLSLGHITEEIMGMITFIGVMTILVSTYMILYSEKLYEVLSRFLKIFERSNPYRESVIANINEAHSVDVILLGLGNYGGGLADYLLRRNKKIIGVDFDPGVLERWRARGVSVLYGDMADPEIYEQLPLNKTRWIVSSIRSEKLNLTLIRRLRRLGYTGKIGLTAVQQQDADAFEKAGAQLVFRPFVDAAEQAADALAYAMDFMPADINWPIAFREVSIRSDAAVAGLNIREIPIRATTGASILAISRAGRIHYDPGPDFRVYPKDRLVIVGAPEELHDAEDALNQIAVMESVGDANKFELAEIRLAEETPLAGKTLAAISFRQTHKVTVVGIRRKDEQITKVDAFEPLFAGDVLIVVGISPAIVELKEKEPL